MESGRGGPQEIDRQAACLIKWARERNALLAAGYTAGLRKFASPSAEHEVFFRPTDNRVVKCTYPGTFGITPEPKGIQTHATPVFYLRRLQLMNRLFHSDLRMEGVLLGKSLILFAQGEQASIVISQEWFHPADKSNPYPTENEIAEFMTALDFAVSQNSYFGWYREMDGIKILDARPDNFIKSAAGVVPIDLVVSQ
jgi:hypothetical protein